MKHFFTFLVLFIGLLSQAQTFENMEASIPNLYNSITAFGDADGDGDLDLYLSGADETFALAGGLYLYDEGAYTLSDSGLPLLSLGSAAWGDVTGDGLLDILIMGYDDDNPNVDGFTDVFENNGDGTFTALNLVSLPPCYAGEVALVDFNNDTHLDIALTGQETVGWANVTFLYTNNGDGTFSQAPDVTLPGMNFGRIKFADYNNDGNPDFVLSGMHGTTYAYYTKIFTNNGDGTFTESGIELNQSWLGDTEWGDYNADGNIDLVVSGTGGDSGMERMTLIYKNNGDGTFTDINANLMGVSHSSLEWGDFDADGDVDLLVLGAFTTPGDGNYTHAIYNNNGDDTFTESSFTLLNTAYYGDADSGDIDGDGKIDLVISGYDENDAPASAVYKNTTTIGVDELASTSFSIYPNPNTSRQLFVDFNENTISASSEISILTLSGVCVYKGTLQQNTAIYLSNLSSGTYLVKIVSDDKVGAKKLLIK